MCVPNLKFVALPVPEIIGGTLKFWALLGAHAPFTQKCLGAIVLVDPANVPVKF